MRVWRVEHRDHGIGPYRNLSELGDGEMMGRVEDAVRHTQWDRETHPTPAYDGLGRIEEDEVCGFASMQALLDWFDSETLEILAECGYVIRAYYAKLRDARMGRRQVVFRRHHAKLLATAA